MGLVEGKKILVMGIANEKSIAWSIAQKLKEFWEYAEEKKFDEVTLISRLIPIMTTEVSGGFFCG